MEGIYRKAEDVFRVYGETFEGTEDKPQRHDHDGPRRAGCRHGSQADGAEYTGGQEFSAQPHPRRRLRAVLHAARAFRGQIAPAQEQHLAGSFYPSINKAGLYREIKSSLLSCRFR